MSVQLLGGLQHVSASFTPQCSELQNNVSAFAFNPKFSPKLVQTAVSVGTEVVVSVVHFGKPMFGGALQHVGASASVHGLPWQDNVDASDFNWLFPQMSVKLGVVPVVMLLHFANTGGVKVAQHVGASEEVHFLNRV